MSKKRKIVLILSMVAVLAVAAVLNVTLLANNNKTTNGTNNAVATGSFFATSRLDRQTTRNYEISELNGILAMEGEEYANARQTALVQKQKIVDAMETEMLLETLLKAQGFDDVLVSVNSAGNNVSVIVDKDELTRADTVKIYNIIATETSVSPDYVKILSI